MRQLKCKIAEQFRHLLMQVDKNSVDIEILLDLETKKTVRLKELIPDWWGYTRFNEKFCNFPLVEFEI